MERTAETSVRITGWGSHVPSTVMTNADVARLVGKDPDWMYARSGIRERRVARDGENTSSIAAEAGRMALADAGCRADDLDALICTTSTPDFRVPHCAAIVQDLIGARNAFAIDVGATFSGFVYALAQAQSLVRSRMATRVLVVAAETLTRLVDWSDPTTCFLFGDGAGAAVVELDAGTDQLGPFFLGSASCNPALISVAGACYRAAHPAPQPALRPMIAINGAQLFQDAVRVLVHAVETSLTGSGSGLADYDWIVPHQANLRIVECVAKRLGVPMDRFLTSLDRYGNTGAAGIPLTIAHAVQTGAVTAGDRLLLVSCGGGMVWGSAALRHSSARAEQPTAKHWGGCLTVPVEESGTVELDLASARTWRTPPTACARPIEAGEPDCQRTPRSGS